MMLYNEPAELDIRMKLHHEVERILLDAGAKTATELGV